MREVSLGISILSAALMLTACESYSAESDSGDPHAGPTMNFHRIDSELATGGHLTSQSAVESLIDQGVSVVIDLRDSPPDGHAERLQSAGIRYENIPVVWNDPRIEDFHVFSDAMDKYEDSSVLVQCQANYRASAMTYAYRVTSGNASNEEARKDLEAIWTPEGTWERYLDEIIESQ